MCTICKAFRPYSKDCDYSAISSQEPVNETTDAANGITTGYDISVGARFIGEIDSDGDRDWVRVELVAGATYDVNLTGSPSDDGTLEDPVFGLYDQAGEYISGDDDGGEGTESSLSFTADSTGTYYLVAESYGSGTGTYQLSITQTGAPTPPRGPITADIDVMADYLTDGYWEEDGAAGHSFDTSESNEITVNLDGLTAEGIRAARWGMEAWEAVADIEFFEISGDAQITFDDEKKGAYASYSRSGSETTSVDINVSTGWIKDDDAKLGSYGLKTYIHEIGHALGLGHMGNYNGGADFGVDNIFAEDSWQLTIMSYFSQDENTNVGDTYAEVVSAMAVDIVAIQNIYGGPAAGSITGGNTVYGKNHTLGESWLGQLFDTPDFNESTDTFEESAFSLTIFDVGGFDRIDFSGDVNDQRVDLREMATSDTFGWTGNMVIARDTVIEAYTAGDGNDRVQGNDANNTLVGNWGNDTLLGGLGNDRLTGNDGNDVLTGGAGRDRLQGGNGADRLDGGDGTDLADFSDQSGPVTVDLADNTQNSGGAAGDVLTSIENVNGTKKGDAISGNDLGNVLKGLKGSDTIDGRGGDDRLIGSGGRDKLFGAEGSDTLRGGGGSDQLMAGADDDTLVGNGGRDRLSGEGGDDIMTGGRGVDTFIYSSGADVIRDFSTDNLILDQSLFASGETADQLADRISLVGDDTVFDFGLGNTLTLKGFSDIAALESQIDIA